jgi:hypothetical protein
VKTAAQDVGQIAEASNAAARTQNSIRGKIILLRINATCFMPNKSQATLMTSEVVTAV